MPKWFFRYGHSMRRKTSLFLTTFMSGTHNRQSEVVRMSKSKKTELSLVGEAQAPAIEEIQRPCFAVYDYPTVAEGRHYSAGTWYHDIKVVGKDERSVPVDRWIC